MLSFRGDRTRGFSALRTTRLISLMSVITICRVFVARPSERRCDRGGRDAHDAVLGAGEKCASEGLSENVSDVVGGVALAHLDDAVDLGLAHDGDSVCRQ